VNLPKASTEANVSGICEKNDKTIKTAGTNARKKHMTFANRLEQAKKHGKRGRK